MWDEKIFRVDTYMDTKNLSHLFGVAKLLILWCPRPDSNGRHTD